MRLKTSILKLVWIRLSIVLISGLSYSTANASCQLVNTQCTDKSLTKTIGAYTFNLTEACSKLGLSGNDCCWNQTKQYYCSDNADTCGQYRQNTNCSLIGNSCLQKDYVTGQCQQYQSTYSCANGYTNVESTICTNVVCANNESGTAAKCYNPKPVSANIANLL